MTKTTEQLAWELQFLRAKASKYAFYGVLIASASVVVATLLVSYFMIDRITLDGVMLAQRDNVALWMLDAMPFVFALWGQYASFKMAGEATVLVKNRTSALRAALDEVKLTSQAKSDFFSKMSHELRTPLNGVIGMVDMLLETRLDSEQRRYVDIIRSSSHGLLNLINDLLDFSKIEAGKLVLEEIEFDLRECVEGAVALLSQQARLKGLRVVTRIPPELPARLIGDPGRLRQIIINLVNNAIKFTEKGEVRLEAGLVEDTGSHLQLRIEVSDTGIGIPVAALKHLFQPYAQADVSITRKFGGTGLGLAISKELAEAMQGRIGVTSKENAGSTFWFTARLARAARAAAPAGGEIELKGLRALLADENPVTRGQMAQELRALGLEVEEVGDGVAALQMILVAATAGYRFDLVITDMFLPCMSGEDLGREIKSREQTRETVLIMMTAVGQRGDAQRANQIGFAAYMQKPIPCAQLSPLLSRAMAMRTLSETQRRVRGLITRYTLAEGRKPTGRILLAEDSAVNREIALRMLQKIGYEADFVVDGREAVDAARSRTYDAVLMDLQMPVMDGLAAIQAIRTLPAPRGRVPIIALTAGVTDEERRRCLAEGADAVLLKPTNSADLADTLSRLLEGPATQETREPPITLAGNRELARIFIGEAKQRLQSLREGMQENDRARIAREAHTLKGASAHFHAHEMREAAARLEQLAAAGNLTEAQPLLRSLEIAFDALRRRLEQPTPDGSAAARKRA